MTKHFTNDVLRSGFRRLYDGYGLRRLAILSLLGLVACGGAPPPEDPVPADEAPAEGASATSDPELIVLLDMEVLTPGQERRIKVLDTPLRPLPERLAAVAMDVEAPTFARGNALLLLGEFQAVGHVGAFAAGLRAEDPNVRAAAATGLEGLLDAGNEQAIGLLRRALRDEDAWVQARALQSLGAREPEILRAYLERAPTEELRGIAVSLLQLAQERGAPLVAEATLAEGVPPVLSRETTGGHRLVFQADEAWNTWGAAVGRLSVVGPKGDTARIADRVEVVAAVVPAFFSPEERWLVYEAGRTIRVRDLETGQDRAVGEGIAPRPLPFSERFLFLRPERTESAENGAGARLTYGVFLADFAGGSTERIGELSARTDMQTFGNYAPVRWMRVQQSGDRFYLVGDEMSDFQLPDPFGTTTTP